MPVKATNTRQSVVLTRKENEKLKALAKLQHKTASKLIYMAMVKAGLL